MRRALVSFCLALTACAPTGTEEDLRVEPPALPGDKEDARPAREPEEATTALGAKLTERDLRGCQSDADCVVSCRVDGDCCPELCTCTQVYNQGFLTELTAFQEVSCKDPSCPIAKCAPPRELKAVCRSGLCELEEPLEP